MPSLETVGWVALASLILALTPGPNLAYLVSRTVAQGRTAGLLSWTGTCAGLVFHMSAAALGLSAVLAAVPYAFEAIRWAGVAYLLWLATSTIASARKSATARDASAASPPRSLFLQALLTSVLNPKVALFYLALFPQFVDPANGPVLAQSLVLGSVQIVVVGAVDLLVVVGAGLLAARLTAHARWLRWQRVALGSAFGALAAWLALDRRTG